MDKAIDLGRGYCKYRYTVGFIVTGVIAIGCIIFGTVLLIKEKEKTPGIIVLCFGAFFVGLSILFFFISRSSGSLFDFFCAATIADDTANIFRRFR